MQTLRRVTGNQYFWAQAVNSVVFFIEMMSSICKSEIICWDLKSRRTESSIDRNTPTFSTNKHTCTLLSCFCVSVCEGKRVFLLGRASASFFSTGRGSPNTHTHTGLSAWRKCRKQEDGDKTHFWQQTAFHTSKGCKHTHTETSPSLVKISILHQLNCCHWYWATQDHTCSALRFHLEISVDYVLTQTNVCKRAFTETLEASSRL